MRITYSANLYSLLLCSITVWFYTCTPKPVSEKNLTLITLGFADSANEQNKGLVISSYVFIDLNKDSVYAYSKYYPDPLAEAEISSYSGIINDIGKKDSTLLKFMDRSKHLKLKSDSVADQAFSFHCVPSFILITQEGLSKNVIFSGNYQYDAATEYNARFIRDLSNNKLLKKVNIPLNQDSVLSSLLSHSELSSVPGPPPIRELN
ncbi:hypothetical protein [Sabulibacter ruber]|uniref:hypothetical protein n=1 Tax=Sabulibacter ruber TaxID=2811901 RepID=UPI001A97BC4F|nr:hypothetical protein [Sabulibacter ruber]